MELKRRFAEVMQAAPEDQLAIDVYSRGRSSPAELYGLEDIQTKMSGPEPTDDSTLGGWRAAVVVFPLTGAEFLAATSTTSNLVPFLTQHMHHSSSTATSITNNVAGTSYLLTLLGGFVADSYLGTFWTIAAGVVITSLGMGILTFSAAFPGLQPAHCVPAANAACPPARARYMAPLYVALYIVALGTGLVRPNTAALGADQFDECSSAERKQSINFFPWYYFFVNIGLVIALTVSAYIQDNVSRAWGYGFSLAMYTAAVVAFFVGSPRFRPRAPAGSFLTRLVQVFVAAFRKRRSSVPLDFDSNNLYNATLFGSRKFHYTNQLRVLDRAAVIEEEDRDALHAQAGAQELGWRLCSVTQVEEAKRVLQMLPIWALSAAMSVAVSQLPSLSVLQGQSLDRRLELGKHSFPTPSSSLFVTVLPILFSLLSLPIHHGLLLPFVRRFTNHPYGISPLQRFGTSIFLAVLAMVAAALVEQRRLRDVRSLGFQDASMGTFTLPMKIWWLVPQLFFSSQMDLLLFISQYQFFYYEASDNTRSMASSFTYSACAIGYFCSSIFVNVVNKVTQNQQGGSWLGDQVNNGGLVKFFWVLSMFLVVDLLCFLAYAHHYHYKFDWHHLESQVDNSDNSDQEQQWQLHVNAPCSKVKATNALVHDIEPFREQWSPQ